MRLTINEAKELAKEHLSRYWDNKKHDPAFCNSDKDDYISANLGSSYRLVLKIALEPEDWPNGETKKFLKQKGII